MIIAPVTSNPKSVVAGGVVTISCETRTEAGVLTTPGTSYLIVIYGPTGAIIQASTTMTAAATGILTYAFATTTAMTSGECRILITVVHSALTYKFESEPGWSCNFEIS